MKNRVYKEFRRSLNLFNLVVDRKQLIIKTFLCLVFLSAFLCRHSSAGTWRDTFDGNELNGWERTAEHNIWNAKWEVFDGILFSQIRKPRNSPRCENTAADFLHWNALQFRLDKLKVTGVEMNYVQEGPNSDGEICLFLGKKLRIVDFAVEGYIFSPEEIREATFSKKNDFSKGRMIARYGNKFPLTSQHLNVVFNSGNFRVYTNGVLLTQFVDNRYAKIDVVGLLITCHFGGEWFVANISSFSVSGDSIPNKNWAVQLQETHLTTTWGDLKWF